MGLAAFVFFVVPWMVLAVWLFRLPSALRLGAPSTPWRPLTQFPDPPRDQRTETNPANSGAHDGSQATGGDKHEPFVSV
jgi:hypothetical protein